MKSIDVTIAGRAFPLKVTDEEESMVLRVTEEINEKVRNLQKTYQQKDKQDCLSMALLTYAVENAKLKGDLTGLQPIKDVTEQIEQSLLRIAL
jgi:cell division protein ZapA